MDKLNNSQFVNLLSECTKQTFSQIDTLLDFYNRTYNDFESERKAFCSSHSIGIQLANALDSFRDLIAKSEICATDAIEQTENTPIGNLKVSDFIKIIVDDTNDSLIVKYSMQAPKHFDKDRIHPNTAKITLQKFSDYRRILITSVLSSIITVFEEYLSRVYTLLIQKNPERYISTTQVSVSTLLTTPLSEITAKIIEDEVEAKMFNSLELLDELSKKEAISINRSYNIIEPFEETYQRRNVYIHNRGFANHFYFSKVSNPPKGISLGDYLLCPPEYINSSINTTYKLVYKITEELLRNIPFDEKHWDFLESICFSFLLKGNYEVSQYVYSSLSNIKQFDFDYRTRYKINELISLKHLGKTELFNKELKTIDFSALKPLYVMARDCLTENFENVFNLLKIIPETEIVPYCVRDWPLFIDFRKSEWYLEYKKLHIEDFKEFNFTENDTLSNSDKIESVCCDECSDNTSE